MTSSMQTILGPGGMLAVLAILMPGLGQAATGGPAAGALMRPDQVGRGELLLDRGRDGLYLPAPILMTEIRVTVSGMVARVVVRQRFRNPTDDWVEGRYVFPLSEEGAVDRMRIVVGETVIEGRIAERQAARRRYRAAKESGRRASLLEQERPNIFTASLANIGPGQEVAVEIAYREALPFRDGRFSLRLPLVVGPRYIPGPARLAQAGPGGPPLSSVPDAGRITPPLADPAQDPINPVRLSVDLDPGFPLASVTSPHHPIAVEARGDGRFAISLADGPVPADRDLVLEWVPDTGHQPAAALFTEAVGGETYLMIMVMPSTLAPPEAERPPREVVFVIDTSGSMHGTSIAQARRALLIALQRLGPRQRFNVVRFAGDASQLFARARPANRQNLERARRFVRGLDAEGGTEMLKALRLALDGGRDPGRLRQVVFLTDGEVGNEAELFDFIKRRLGDSRLFTVGIGSAPNGYFMRKAAQFGGGSFTFIGRLDRVAEKMGALFTKLERPTMTDLGLTWSEGPAMESWPRRLPDLYDGEPVLATARLPRPAGVVTVHGRLAGRPWQAVFALDRDGAGANSAKGVAALWAADKVAALIDGLHDGADPEAVRARVIEVALKHRLVTRYTSLVAVETDPARPADAGLETREVPTNLPQGWEPVDPPDGPDLPHTQRASAAPSRTAMALAAAPAPAPTRLATIAQGPGTLRLDLPQTATPAPLHLAIGAAALLLALLLACLAWRRDRLPLRARRRAQRFDGDSREMWG